MLNCRQVVHLVSRSMDQKLSWRQRLAVKFHFLYCVWCRRYSKQIQFLRKAARLSLENPNDLPKLTPEAKAKMAQRLKDASK